MYTCFHSSVDPLQFNRPIIKSQNCIRKLKTKKKLKIKLQQKKNNQENLRVISEWNVKEKCLLKKMN